MKTASKIYIARLIYNFLKIMRFSKYQTVERGGIKWKLDISEGIDLNLFLFGSFEKELIQMINNLSTKKNFKIIDIGSNIGVHSLQFASHFPEVEIFSIEPTDYAFNKLKENLKLNTSLKNKIKIFQNFITHKKIPEKVYSSWSLQNSNNTHKVHKGSLKETNHAKIISLDEFTKKNNLKENVIIKCDVDGYELDVFESGKTFLNNYKPDIVMELAPYLYSENGYKDEDIFNFFLNLNYVFFDGSNFRKINNIYEYSKNIKFGSSKNIFLKKL